MAEFPTIPGSPATPFVDPSDGNTFGGLTKREYFAAHAMVGLLGNSKFNPTNQLASVAKTARDAADALIVALNKKPGQL